MLLPRFGRAQKLAFKSDVLSKLDVQETDNA